MRRLFWLDVLGYAALAAYVFACAPRTVLYWIGLGLAVAGWSLWVVARLQLGGAFSLRPRARGLVTTGIRARIRHPIYFFSGFAWMGLLMALRNGAFLLAFMLLFCALEIARARREESVLERAFGDEYRRYKARTWF